MKFQRITLLTAAVGTIATAAFGQISVQYNGRSIGFTDAQPKMSGGRVLVPLRAVLEGMGVDVKFDAATSLITASQTDTTVQLRLGSREATVNGKPVYLDVPAQAVNGRTYIPLRFFGEAFGADVKWRAYDETVLITQNITWPDPNPGTGTGSGNTNPVAYGLSHNAVGWVTGGQTINFELRAAPGQTAKLYLQDGALEIPFKETSSGVYRADYVVPASQSRTISFEDLDAFAVVGTGASRVAIQTTQRVAVDNKRPDVSNLQPQRLQKVAQRRPAITADLKDENGSGIDATSVRLWVDGKDMTSEAYITDRLVVLKPTSDLSIGRHDVKLTVNDNAGNTSTVETEFEVVAAANLVQNFTIDAPAKLEPGDRINLAARVGSDVQKVMVKLGGQDTFRNANLDSNGQMTFSYTVAKGDSFDNSPITLRLEMKNGDKLDYVADKSLTVVGATTPMPKLVSPAEGTDLGSSVVIKGTAERAATVRVRIEYESSVFGLLKTQGLVKEVEVEVASDGTFSTDSIKLSGPLGSNPDSYKVTLTSISANGRESEPVTFNYKG